jgi:hypothetical protein
MEIPTRERTGTAIKTAAPRPSKRREMIDVFR